MPWPETSDLRPVGDFGVVRNTDQSPPTERGKKSTLIQFQRRVGSISRCIQGSNEDTRTVFGAKRKTKFDDYGKGNVLNYAT